MTTTTRREWLEARSKGIEITLPDYNDTVAIRPMDAMYFFKAGKVPDFLAGTVQKILNGEAAKLPPFPTDEKTSEWLTWLDELVTYTFVSPKVVENPHADDEIGIDEISYTDKLFIYTLFARPAAFLREFHKQQIKSLSPVDAAKNNGHLTEPVVAGTPVGE